MIEENDYGINSDIWDFLDKIKADILRFKITKEILTEEYNKFKQLYENTLYPAEEASIEKLKVEPKDNIFDYYK